jgi:hypothetical protein
MTLFFQSHGGKEQANISETAAGAEAAPPIPGDISADEQADFGYFFPPLDAPDNYLPASATTVTELDTLGNLMVDQGPRDPAGADSKLPPVFTYWGQFLDHELTARTNAESSITNITNAHPPAVSATVESQMKNARTPRFDLDSVYGGTPIGDAVTPDAVKVVAGMRHPTQTAKMRVGTSIEPGPLPDTLDEHRDLPRFVQVQQSVKNAALALAQSSMPAADFAKFQAGLPQRALIGDQRNDENLIVAQFHLSFLRFHNRVVDFLASHNTGWVPDFHSAQTLTRLHYQWLIVEGYLRKQCDNAVVDRVLNDRASHFFKFRAEFDARQQKSRLGNALPLEFAVAAYRFGHSMVRGAYDHNNTFGRPNGVATLDLLFNFTGGGGMFGSPKLPKNWVIDWARFVGTSPNDGSDNQGPARLARKIDTSLTPPLGNMLKEANDEPVPDIKKLFKQLARRNLRRGYNLKLPTGQALHKHLKQIGAVTSNPIADVSTQFSTKPDLKTFLTGSQSKFHQRTPLWFYILAEAEAAGGDRLGEVGSWLVAATFIGILLADPDSALSKGFTPSQSPLRMPDNSPVDSIAKWMQFALVMP